MPTPYFLYPSIDRGASASIDTFWFDWHEAAQNGAPYQYFELLRSLASRESVLASALQLRKRNVANVHLAIQPGFGIDQKENLQAQRNAELLKKVLSDIDLGPFFAHNAFGIPAYGLVLSEIEWQSNRPVNIWPIDARAVGWTTPIGINGFSQLPNNTPLLMVGPARYSPLWPGHWIVVQDDHEGTPADWSAIRKCIYSVFLVINGLKSWFRYVNQYGMPIPKFVLPDNAPEEVRQEAALLAKQFFRGDKALLTEAKTDIKIEFIDAAAASRVGSSDVQQRLVDACTNHIDRVITGGILNQQAGSGGSYALGTVHKSAAESIYSHDVALIGRALTHQLVKPWMRRNALDGPMPVIRPYTRAELLNALSTASWLVQSSNRSIQFGNLEELESILGVRLVQVKNTQEPDNV